jgi:hypothetical protein
MEGTTQSAEAGTIMADTRSQKEGCNVEKTLVVVFDDEAKALRRFACTGGAGRARRRYLDELAIIVKYPDGNVRVETIGR